MIKLLSWYKSNFRIVNGNVALTGSILGALYGWFYKDGDLVYMIVGFLISAAIIAIVEKMFID